MQPRFDCFVVFAEMRTGSNFLETNLNSFIGLRCYGEAFNPAFIGYPNVTDILGVTQAERDADPSRLLAAIRSQPGMLGGFRFFNNHDPRLLDLILPDPRVAKIILTRNPIESYVSRKIAAITGQWKLTNAKHARSESVRFDGAEFEDHLERLQAFQVHLLNALQRTGQTAFYLDYNDLQNVDVMNGLAAFLGTDQRIEALDKKLKKQNPEPLDDKVANFDEMEMVLARLDRFNLNRTPNFEPRRGPGIPAYYAAGQSPLLYMPIKSGPEAAVIDWLKALDGTDPVTGFTHKTLRQWKLDRPGHRSFTVIRHPLARAHAAFCDRILSNGKGSFPEIRENLRRTFALPLPEGPVPNDLPSKDRRAAFKVFLTFLKANLGGQTNIRPDAAWAGQAAQLQGMAQFALPDFILREDRLAADVAILAWSVGRTDAPDLTLPTDPHHESLAAIYDDELESLARDACSRDYMTFGFGSWT